MKKITRPINRLMRSVSSFAIKVLAGVERSGNRLLDAFRSVTSSISTLIERTAKKAFSGRKIRRGLSVADQAVAGGVGKLFAPVVRRFLGVWGAMERLLHRIRKHRLIRWVFFLAYPLVGIAVFLASFFRTRSRVAWLAIGIFLAALIGFFSVQRILEMTNARLSERYRNAMIEEMAKGNLEEANLYKSRLLSLGLPQTDFEMKEIQRLVAAGREEEAMAFAETIAPLDKPGFADAHFWIAQQLLNGKSGKPPEEALKLAELHLDNMKQSMQRDGVLVNQNLPAVTFVRAQMEFRQQRDQEGMRLLATIPKFWPATLALIERNLEGSNLREAFQHALALHGEIKRQPEIAAKMSQADFSMWCTALTAGGDVPELVDALDLWHQYNPENVFVREETMSIKLLQVETLTSRGSSSDLEKAGSLLAEATRNLPLSSHPLLSHWITQRLLPKGSNPSFEKAVEIALTKEGVSSMFLEIVGTAMAWDQNFSEARDLFQRAIQTDTTNAIAWNGLALMELQANRLNEALECANQAVEHGTSNFVFLRTRGQIALKLKRWEQVIEDVKKVVAENPGSKIDHAMLAEAYKGIGNQPLSDLHQAQAKH